MAIYREIMMSGSAGKFSSVTIDTELPVASGGFYLGGATLVDGDLIGGDENGRLERISIGTSQQILSVSDSTPRALLWADDAAANIDNIIAGDSNTLAVNTGGGGSFTLTMVSASVSNGGTALVTGDHLYDFVVSNPLGKTNVDCTLTAISASSTATSYGIGLESEDKNGALGNITTNTGTIQLNGAFANIPNTAIGNGTSDARFVIGTLGNAGGVLPLGGTRADVNKLQGISVSSGNITLFDGVGANDLTIADATSEVKFPGNLTVEGTASFIDASTLRIKDDTFLLNDVNPAAASDGGFIVAQNSAGSDNVAFTIDISNKSLTPQTGTYSGQWGFPSKSTISNLEGGVGASAFTMQVIKSDTSDPTNTGEFPDRPQYGGGNGVGHLWVNRSSNKAFIYV